MKTYARFEAFCRVIDAVREVKRSEGQPTEEDVQRGHAALTRNLATADLDRLSWDEITEFLRIHVASQEEWSAIVRELAVVADRHGARTLGDGVERMSELDRGNTALVDLAGLQEDAREANRRLGRPPRESYDVEAAAASSPIVLAAALRAGMLD